MTLQRFNITKHRASEGSAMDVAHGEMVEAELIRLTEKRSSKEMDPDEREELWKESVRAYTASRHKELRDAWYEYHKSQAERHRVVLEALKERHEEQAKRYRNQPEGEE